MALYSETSDCCCSDVRAVEEPRAGRAATLWALLLFFYSMVLGGNGTVNQEQNFGNFSKLLPFYTVVYSYLQLKVASETWGDVFHLEEIEQRTAWVPWLSLSTWAAARTGETAFWKNRSEGLMECIPAHGRGWNRVTFKPRPVYDLGDTTHHTGHLDTGFIALHVPPPGQGRAARWGWGLPAQAQLLGQAQLSGPGVFSRWRRCWSILCTRTLHR